MTLVGKKAQLIELFKQRKFLLDEVGNELENKLKRIEEFNTSGDPEVFSRSANNMLNNLTEIHNLDKKSLILLNNDKDAFDLYCKLANVLLEENYEEASKIKIEIDKL